MVYRNDNVLTVGTTSRETVILFDLQPAMMVPAMIDQPVTSGLSSVMEHRTLTCCYCWYNDMQKGRVSGLRYLFLCCYYCCCCYCCCTLSQAVS